MLATTLWWNVTDGAFQNLEKGLLHSLARNVTCNRHVIRLTADLIDLVDINDPAFGLLYIVIGGLEETKDNIFHVLAAVAGLC